MVQMLRESTVNDTKTINKLLIKATIKNIYLWIFVWLVLVIYYALSIGVYHKQHTADEVAYITQMFADVSVLLTCFVSYIRSKIIINKKFMKMMLISVIVGLFSSEIYNFLFNIFKLESILSGINDLWLFPYTIFLVMQIIAWYFLYKQHLSTKQKNHLLSYIPLAIAALFLIVSILFNKVFAYKNINSVDFLQLANTFLEVILFVILSLCLSRTKSKALSVLSSGFLLLLAFNIAHRVSILTGYYYKTFDIAWLLSYIFIIFGFYYCAESPSEDYEFCESNSFMSVTSGVLTLFSLMLLLVFILLEFFITSLEINSVTHMQVMLKNIPSLVVFSVTLSVIASRFFAKLLTSPLNKITQTISNIKNTQKYKLDKIESNKEIMISEIKDLHYFILSTISDLYQANRVKSDFLMNMSHDFRTPASGVHSMSLLVLKKLDDEKLRSLQNLIVDSSRQLLDLLDSVLDYSRLENNVINSNITEIELKSVIDEVTRCFAAKIEEKGLVLETQIIENEQLFYIGDRLLLLRILINLISNAVKFTNTGSVKIHVDTRKDNNQVFTIINVIDTGIGIKKEYFDKIFIPFFRLDSVDVSKYEGIGLGLSNVKLMVNKLKGEIFIESEINKGTKFTLLLPNLK